MSECTLALVHANCHGDKENTLLLFFLFLFLFSFSDFFSFFYFLFSKHTIQHING
jgi:hypothetical protein